MRVRCRLSPASTMRAIVTMEKAQAHQLSAGRERSNNDSRPRSKTRREAARAINAWAGRFEARLRREGELAAITYSMPGNISVVNCGR